MCQSPGKGTSQDKVWSYSCRSFRRMSYVFPSPTTRGCCRCVLMPYVRYGSGKIDFMVSLLSAGLSSSPRSTLAASGSSPPCSCMEPFKLSVPSICESCQRGEGRGCGLGVSLKVEANQAASGCSVGLFIRSLPTDPPLVCSKPVLEA